MPAITTWNNFATWSEWVNESDPTGDQTPIRRIINDSLKTPFEPSSFNGLTGEATLARWRFGQFFGDTAVLADQEGNSNTATIPAGVAAETSEFGLRCQTRNGYAIVNESSTFDQPANPPKFFILSLWFKSNIIDYLDNYGIIAAWHNNALDIGYGIAVNTNGAIVAKYYDGATTQDLSPSGGNVFIDTAWHHALLILNRDGPKVGQLFVVDNNFGTGESDPLDLITGTKQFTIGSSEFVGETEKGFTGIIDEVFLTGATTVASGSLTDSIGDTLGDQHRYEANTFLGPVVDTLKDNSVLQSILATYTAPSDSSVTFSFRASNTQFTQSSSTPAWTGFTAPLQVLSGVDTDVTDIGVFAKGRYQQIRIKLSPSTDNLQINAPEISSLTLNTSESTQLIYPSNAARQPGEIIGQVVEFGGNKQIDKVSLNLSVTTRDPKTFVVGSAGTLSWQAANFQVSRDNWAFQPVDHRVPGLEWETSGLTMANSNQTVSYDFDDDAVANAPFISYSLFFPASGVYDMWGFGYTSGSGIYWGLDGDQTDVRLIQLGSESFSGVPRWTRFGRLFLEEGGEHTFTVYLGETGLTILDQWYFTTNTDLTSILTAESGDAFAAPLPLSRAPFMTALRMRSISNGQVEPLSTPSSGAAGVTAWQPSTVVMASGKFNYEVRDNISGPGVVFTDGMSLEFMQIGGSRDHFASWDFNFVDDSVGSAFRSDDFGATYTNEQ